MELHHRGSQGDIKPAAATHPSSLWKCNRLLFRKIIKIGVEDFFNGLVCKLVRTGGVQLCNVRNFPCAVFKINFNFAPLAVVVCLVFIDCGGDFLFSADDLLLFYCHGADGVVLYQQSRQVIHSLAVTVYEPEIIRLREAGLTRQEIADELGLTKIQIKNWINRHNKQQKIKDEGERRPNGRPRKDGLPPKQNIETELKRLRMENKLLRDFLQSVERM